MQPFCKASEGRKFKEWKSDNYLGDMPHGVREGCRVVASADIVYVGVGVGDQRVADVFAKLVGEDVQKHVFRCVVDFRTDIL
jgi:hypothetical protein